MDNQSMTINRVIANNLNRLMSDNTELNTNEKLAAKSKVGRSTIQRARAGDANLTVANLYQLAAALKRPVHDLLEQDAAARPAAAAEPASTYSVIKNQTRVEIEKLLDQTDSKGLEVALLAIQQAFAMRSAQRRLNPSRLRLVKGQDKRISLK